MARIKKLEGIEELVAPMEQPSIQEITMLDWYAAFALMSNTQSPETAAKYAFDRAEAMMAEREKRL
jgi:ATP phosphoribosyltransferase